jgi:hypothetical protein
MSGHLCLRTCCLSLGDGRSRRRRSPGYGNTRTGTRRAGFVVGSNTVSRGVNKETTYQTSYRISLMSRASIRIANGFGIGSVIISLSFWLALLATSAPRLSFLNRMPFLLRSCHGLLPFLRLGSRYKKLTMVDHRSAPSSDQSSICSSNRQLGEWIISR